MTISKRIFTILTILIAFAGAKADNGINSPYSRYGIGILDNQSLSINRQMGGLGYGLRSDSYINIVNPASFSQADTLTMLFEAGLSLQDVYFKENGKGMNAINASFDYIAMQYRLFKGLGMSIGFLPYSNVGYSFSTTSSGGENNAEYTTSYAGTGGLYQPYVGLGWNAFKGLSIGTTLAYLYGDITHEIQYDLTDSNVDNYKTYTAKIRSYKLDFGLQYDLSIAKKHDIVLGATYSLGHKMSTDAIKTIAKGNETKYDTLKNSFKLPHTFGVGFAYCYNKQWKFGADYTFQKWGSSTFFGEDDKGIDCHKVSAGVEYVPNEPSNKFYKMISYRGGLYIAQPYIAARGNEFGVSAGLSLPIMNRNNKYNSALLHISGEYVHMSPKSAGFITENCIRLNIGITFNEAWFTKMKVK